MALLFAALSLGTSHRAGAQAAGPPDFTQFGFPNVVGTVQFTPGTTATISAGTQQVVLPADFISKTVKFDLLEGDASTFGATLPITDQGREIIVAWAFRVTDVSTNQLLARFDKPVQWSVTDPRIVTGSAVYNTTAANPPVVTANAAPGTISGTTLSHPFGGAGVGWLVLGPPGQAAVTPTATAPTALPTEAASTAVPTQAASTAVPTEAAPTAAPTEVVVPTVAPAPTEVVAAPTEVPPVAIGMPATGGGPDSGAGVALLGLLALVGTAVGVAIRRRQTS